MADDITPSSPLDDMLAGRADAGDLHAEITALSDAGAHQVIDAMHDAAAEGSLASLDLDKAVGDAQNADWHRLRAEDNKIEMVRAEERGDYDAAKDLAGKEQYELSVAQDSGAHVDGAVHDASHDVQALDQAEWDHDVAQSEAHDSAWYADHGMAGSAETAADTSVGHEVAAVDSGASADHGGSVAMHDSVTTDEAASG